MRSAKLPINVAFGLAVRHLRDENGLSQEALGFRTGLHRNHVGQIERAEVMPTLGTVETIAEALNIRSSELIVRAERLSG
jgi:transcriptional regulator with XRE-family HTH domain